MMFATNIIVFQRPLKLDIEVNFNKIPDTTVVMLQ